MSERVVVYFNPACSKSRAARALLEERGVQAEYRHYLERAPTHAELTRLLASLGTSDARLLVRTGEPIYATLGLDEATTERLLDAIVEHPSLLERPIVVRGDLAVIARPAEKLLALLDLE